MVTIKKYEKQDKELWNGFVYNSKMPMFMFDRDYMEYHKDRFLDYSLLFYNEKELVAAFPACIDGTTVISHGGLTYGGFITNSKMKQHVLNECFASLVVYLKADSIIQLIYKNIPHIYHNQMAEEDKYALFSLGAKLRNVDASTILDLKNPLKMSKGRKAQISRAKREGVLIQVLSDAQSYNEFIALENGVLKKYHNTMAVHSADEIKLLHDRFPNNIHLVAAKYADRLIAGSIIYEYADVIHTQYMAANDEARKIGALDLVINSIIEHYKFQKKWLDFGISNEHDNNYLNEGLISQKEGFGGRTGVYEIWELDINKK